MDTEKIYLALISVGVGWLLAQGTTLAKAIWNTRRIKMGLLMELSDISGELQRCAMSYARHIQVYSKRGCEPSITIGISNLFFGQYYKDVMLSLNRDQRLSYQTIHKEIDALNKQFENIEIAIKKCLDLQGSEALGGAIDEWGEMVKSTFINIRSIQWHVTHHLNNSDQPRLGLLTEEHRSFVKNMHAAQEELGKIIEDAGKFSREDFEKIYDENSFAPVSI